MAPRLDGRVKATGDATYTADATRHFPSWLVGGVLTTEMAHSAVAVDVDRLKEMPGVVAVLGPDDDPGRYFTTNPHGGSEDRLVFAREGRFAGDIVGAVAAIDRTCLEAAVRLPGVVSETPLEAVTSLDDALFSGRTANARYPANILAKVDVGAPLDLVDEAIAASPLRYRSSILLSPSPHGFLERVAALARWDAGRCRVWSSTQCPSLVGPRIAAVLGVDSEDIVMEPTFIGGGFGGKEEMVLEPATALLSAACGGRPVLVELTREQCTRGFRVRHGGSISVETGFDAQGSFLARRIEITFDAGPYDGHSTIVLSNACNVAVRLYPGRLVGATGRALVTNRTPGGAFRGYGATQAIFAVETHVDGIAGLVDLDPLVLRRRNAPRAEAIDPVSEAPMGGIRAAKCLDVLADRLAEPLRSDRAAPPSEGKPAEGKPADGEPADGEPADGEPADGTRFRRGVGMAMLVCNSGTARPNQPDRAEALCRFDDVSGHFVVETATVEAGQGVYPAIAAVAARELGVSPGLIEVERTRMPDLFDPGMYASRGAHVTCSAAAVAARALRAMIAARAAERLAVAPPDVGVTPDGRVARTTSPPLREVALGELGPLEVRGSYSTDQVVLAYGAQGVELTVDTATGRVIVERVISVHDVGVLLEPDAARAQVEGGVAQGLGGALSERLTFDSAGRGVETGFLGHLVPTSSALVDTVAVLLSEAPGAGEGTGAKGLGEAPVMGVAAAVANAIADAIGHRPAEMPMTPEVVWRLLQELDAPPDSSSVEALGDVVVKA